MAPPDTGSPRRETSVDTARKKPGAPHRPTGRLRLQIANQLKYRGFLLGATLLPRLPLNVSYRLAVLAADLARGLTPGRRVSVAENLRHVLGDAATPEHTARLTREMYRNIARYYVDFLRLPSVDVAELERRQLLDSGYHNLETALAEGRGVIVVTPHFGNPDTAIQAARARGIEFFVLTEQIEPPELAELYLRLRSSHGHRFMSVGLAAAKEAIRTLRRGGSVIIVADRDIQGTGVEATFFGRMTRMPTGAVDLARITGAPIIPAFSRRLPGNAVELLIEPRVELVRTADRLADQRINVERVVKRFEPHIRRDPGQWLVLEPIWPVGATAAQQP